MTEATPVAMEVWRKARSAWKNYPFTNTDEPHDADHQAAAAVIATALSDMQRRVEELEELRAYEKKQADTWRGIAAAMGYEPRAHLEVRPTAKWLLDRIARFREEAARRALSDKTQEKNDG